MTVIVEKPVVYVLSFWRVLFLKLLCCQDCDYEDRCHVESCTNLKWETSLNYIVLCSAYVLKLHYII